MLEFAKQEYRLSQKTANSNTTIRDELELIQRNTGKTPPELMNLVECPDSLYHIWLWYLRLDQARSASFGGISPLQFSEMYAFFKLLGIFPTDFEILLIKKIDHIALETYAEQAEKDRKAMERKKTKK